MRASAARYLGDEAAHVLTLKQLDERLLPISQANVAILAELAGFADPECAGETYAIPYVVLLTHCDLLDAAIDGEIAGASGYLGLAGTLAWFWSLVEEEMLPAIDSAKHASIRRGIASRLAERNRALRIETSRRRTWEPPDERDAAAAAGRSIGVVLFYELLCAVAGRDSVPDVLTALLDYLRTFQLGDDLGDWESDFAAGNHTALLRGTAAQIGPRSTYRRDELARELFLGGCYERYTARLIRDLDDILNRLTNLDGVQTERMQTYVAGKRSDLLSLLTGVVQTKLDYFAAPSDADHNEFQVRRARLHYPLFRRLLEAASRQPEYRAMYGAVWWWLLRRLRFVAYLVYRRRGRSWAEVVFVERGERIVAALGLMPSGELSTLIVIGTPVERRTAMRLLSETGGEILRQSARRHWLRTAASFRSLIATVERLGFERQPCAVHQATLPLGPLTWTWNTRRWRLSGVRIVPLIYLTRPERDLSAP